MLFIHAPVLAALVPGALLTIASLESAERDRRALPPDAEIVEPDDPLEQRKIAAATPIPTANRRVG